MPIPATVFKNILRLEEHKGFADAAVQGGIEAFARRWAEQMGQSERLAKGMADAIAATLAGYAVASQDGRAHAVAKAGELLSLFERGVRDVPKANGKGNGISTIEDFQGFEDEDPRAKAPVSSFRSGIAPAPIEAPPHQPASTRVARRNATLDSSATVLRGVQDATARLLKRLGIYTVRDALLFFPFRYDDFSDLKPIAELEPGVNQTVVGTIWDVDVRKTRNNRPMVTATLADDSGIITVTWFNQEYIAKQLNHGDPVVISGKPIEFNGRLSFNAPEWEPYDSELLHTGRIVPVYHSTEGLYRRTLRRIMHDAVDRFADQMSDYIPDRMKRDAELIDIATAIRQIHFPDSKVEAARARKRLAFDEFLMIQLGMLQRKRAWQESKQSMAMASEPGVLDRFFASLPFELTAAQKRVIGEITGDMASQVPMTRLLQGDVGSGKTVVAASALLVAMSNGAQGVLMAPTEILAEQHYKSLTKMVAGLEIEGRTPTIRLLKGSTPRKEKKQIYE
ncbi:MAG TPA: OB-fold nucleic acid binding domain-containing protein, partial [Chloroflexia bacterium]|nr:OB-fold nucleic acid binding domain-containing protein [Chloroflexia bacterium]